MEACSQLMLVISFVESLFVLNYRNGFVHHSQDCVLLPRDSFDQFLMTLEYELSTY